ncbi:MAG: RHS repeat-associated core domain-containing protein [Opitutae bacterium]|nr:RHS repeat-associated core domain-containing protein [Opitutae bacterium]
MPLILLLALLAIKSMAYDALSLPLTITDLRGKVTTNEYNATGNLTRTIDPTGAVTEFTYDSTGRLTQTRDALNQITTTAYGADGRPASMTNALGHTTSWTYDANGNRLTQTVKRTKTDNTTVTEATGNVYDAENRLTKTTLPDGSFVETSYNSFGKTATTKDQLGRVTSFTYDARGNLTRTDYPDATFETTAYDLENRVTSTTDRLGRTTTTTYDVLDRATRVTAADGTFTQTAYDSAGRVTSTTDARGNVTTFGYDNANRRTSVRDALNQTTTSIFDAAGNQLSFTDSLSRTTGYTYDNRGQRTTVTFPDGTTQVTSYDTLGRKIAATDQEGKIARYRYDALGRLVEVRQYLDSAAAASDSDFQLSALNSRLIVTKYGYDELGHQVTQTDALDRLTRYEYDSLGRRVKRTLPDGAAETYAYNSVGSLTAKTDFAGRTTTFAYDTLNRLKSKTASPSHPSLIYSHAIARVEYDYDASGARIAARTFNASNTQLYSEATPRDLLGRVTGKTTPLGALSYEYYANGLLKDMVSSNASGVNVGYRYDALNRLAFVDDASGPDAPGAPLRTTAYTYTAVGSLETMTTPNAVRHAYQYDTLNRLQSLSVSKLPSQVLHSYTYTLRASGHRQQVAEGNGRTVHYAYDEIYRLTGETITGDPTGQNGATSYVLDKVGNRLSRLSPLAALPSQNFSYSARDWLASDTYDANGNTLTTSLDSGFGILTSPDIYDFEDRLIIRQKPDGTTINLGYNADGIRVQKTIFNTSSVPVSAIGYLVDSNNPTGYAQVVEEYQNSASGTTATVYTYGSDLISQAVSLNSQLSTLSYFAYDGLGSVRALTNASGAVTDTWDYDAFGVLIARTGTTANNYLYRGEQFDPDLGMYSLRARFYNQATGRFWNADTYEGNSSDPMSLHKYLYAGADPVMGFDPSGKISLFEMQVVSSVQTILASIEGTIGLAFADQIIHGGNAGLTSIATQAGVGAVFIVAGSVFRYSWGFAARSIERIANRFPGGVTRLRGISQFAGRPVNLYRYLSGKLPVGYEANHLLPKSIFQRIPEDGIIAVAMQGSKNSIQTEHGLFHAAIDNRMHYALASNTKLTVRQFTNEVLPDALMNAGIDPARALLLAEAAESQARLFYALDDLVPLVTSGVGK